MNKIEIPVAKANRLINFGTVVLVTASFEEKQTITPAAWNSPLSHKPMMVGVALANKHFSSELISKSKQFVLNVPDASLVSKVTICGSVSGRSEDKFKKSGFTKEHAKIVKAPLISDCLAHIECQVSQMILIGDHTLFVGEVVAASAIEGFLDENFIPDISNFKTLQHLGGSEFGSIRKV